MNNLKYLFFLLFFLPNQLFAQIPKTNCGQIVRIENMKSKFVDRRNIDIWLPNNYSPKKKYAVIYMHDGQMLFDTNITWNKQAWFVQNKVQKLIDENKIKDVIIVGIFNNGKFRHSEYFPKIIAEQLPLPYRDSLIKNQLQSKTLSDNYLQFIVQELKPYIDKNYATLSDVNNTFLMGASMGGLISLYAICQYPQVFGGVACLSLHSPMVSIKNMKISKEDYLPAQLFLPYLRNNLPQNPQRKIYMDYGNKTLDFFYKPFQLKIDSVFKKSGYTNQNWQTRFFEGTDHSEKSWSNRLEIPLQFLLQKKSL